MLLGFLDHVTWDVSKYTGGSNNWRVQGTAHLCLGKDAALSEQGSVAKGMGLHQAN